ncbi:MAG: hypothetical protein IKL44_04250 [Clostridia bacterium]|nr:hypothetical protein [Clostridia bacterium]
MKKFLCLLLALALMFSFAACGEKKTSYTDKGDGTIDKYAKEGKIPEYEVSLGSSHDAIVEYFDALAEEQDNEDLHMVENEGNVAVNLANGVQSFYYEKEHKDKGAAVFIVTGDTAFGLEIGTSVTKSDVTKKLSADYTVAEATADQLYFLPGTIGGAEILSASFDNIRLDFFFFDGFLSAISLTDTEYWTD